MDTKDKQLKVSNLNYILEKANDIYSSSIKNRGVWSSSKDYKVNDYISSGDKRFICLVDNTNVNPTTDATKWKEVSGSTVAYVDTQVASKTITIEESNGATGSNVLKNYAVKQGGTLISTISVPKDMFLQSGSIVVDPVGQPSGKYLKLVLNDTTNTPLYINVEDLVDTYTAQASASKIQLAIGANNEISATVVAGSIETSDIANNAISSAKLADNSVITAKLADGSVSRDKLGANVVNEDKLANDSILTDKIKNANVTKVKLSSDVQSSLTKADNADTNIGTLSSLGTTNKTNLVSAINELATGVTNSAVAVTKQATADTGYESTYDVKQGGTSVGKIQIPKGGEYTATTGATQVSIDVNNTTKKIGASLVAGGVDTNELANNSVTTAKITDANVTKAKLATDVQASLTKADNADTAITTLNGSVTTSGSVAKQVKDASDALDTKIGTLSSLSTTNKTNLVSAINEAMTAIGTGGTGLVVAVTKQATPTIGYETTYNVTQGGTSVGKIDIPKGGEYSGATGATEVQVSVDTDKKISATLVNNAVTTTKIADANVTKAKLASDVQSSLTKADTAETDIATLKGNDSTTGSIAKTVKDAKDSIKTEIGTLSSLSTTNKTDLVSAINETFAAVGTGGTGSVVAVSKMATPTSGYEVTYNVTQGGSSVGKIDIPKGGEYSAAASASQVQVDVNNTTKKIGASLVANSVGTTELANTSVTTAKIKDANVTKAKLTTDVQNTLDSVGTLSTLTTTSKTSVVNAINEVVTKISDAKTDSVITVSKQTTAETGYDTTYDIKQGGSSVGKVQIPKHEYDGETGATQVSVSTNNTARTISATLVAGGVGSTELASNAVTTAKIADNAITTAKITDGSITKAKLASVVQDSLDKADAAETNIGTLASLTTLTKDNLVLAINETKGALNVLNSTASTSGSVAKQIKDSNDTYIGDLSTLSTTNKSNIVDAINETFAAVGTGGTGAVVTVTKQATADGDNDSTYNVTQGGNSVGKINIPKAGQYTAVTGATQVTVNVDNVNKKLGASLVAGGVGTADLADGAVNSVKLADNAITTAKISAKAITTAKIDDNAITETQLADDAVSTDKIVNANVTTSKLADSSVTTDKINDSAVTTIKVNDGAITSAKLADTSVNTAKIIDSSVTTVKIADGAITTAKITDGAITTSKLGAKAVTTAKVADGAITAEKIDQDLLDELYKNPSVVNNLTSTATTSSLSAAQGKVLNDKITASDGKIGTLSSLTTSNKTDVVSAINSLKTVVDNNKTDGAVTVEENNGTGDISKVYTIKQGTVQKGVINIPKSTLLKQGAVVKDPTGQPTGTYLKLEFNDTSADPVYINVVDLVDAYTAATNATQVQVAISGTNEISASLVDGGIATAKLANYAVTTDKLAGGAVNADKLGQQAVTTIKLANGAVTAEKIDSDLLDELQNHTVVVNNLTSTSTTSALSAAQGKALADRIKVLEDFINNNTFMVDVASGQDDTILSTKIN